LFYLQASSVKATLQDAFSKTTAVLACSQYNEVN
jgi:hypothetical protein